MRLAAADRREDIEHVAGVKRGGEVVGQQVGIPSIDKDMDDGMQRIVPVEEHFFEDRVRGDQFLQEQVKGGMRGKGDKQRLAPNDRSQTGIKIDFHSLSLIYVVVHTGFILNAKTGFYKQRRGLNRNSCGDHRLSGWSADEKWGIHRRV